MDRLFQRPIICAYLAWRQAKERGSWFTMLLVILMAGSVAGCTGMSYQEEFQARIRALHVTPWAETPEGIASHCLNGPGPTYEREQAARRGQVYEPPTVCQLPRPLWETDPEWYETLQRWSGSAAVPLVIQQREYQEKQQQVDEALARLLQQPPFTLKPGERMETDREAMSRGAFPGWYRVIPAPDPHRPYDARSIYGMDQSKWLALTAKDREHVRFRNFYHGYNDRHLPQARGTHSVPRATSPIITPPAAQAEQPDVQRGMNWEDQYDYGGDGQNDGGGDGGFLP